MRRLLLLLTALFVLAACFVPAAPAAAAWVWPVKGEVITPYRNGSDPYASGQHRGIDIAASVGTPVVAAAGGDVRFAGSAGSSGLTVSVRTSDGYDTSYLHLSSLAVRAGVRVSAGERIGAVGTSGTRSAAAPHLHFGVRDAGTRYAYHDPLAFLPPPPGAPAPDPPASAPAPAPEPARPAPAPAPAPRAPAPVAAPLATAPARRRVPGRGRRTAPVVPLARSAPAPARDPRAERTPALEWGSRPERAHGRASPERAAAPRALGGDSASASLSRGSQVDGDAGSRDAARSEAPSLAAASASSRRAASPPGAPHAVAAEAGSRGHDGPDIGWALACGGLLLAAAILGLRDDRTRSRGPARARLGRALRPLTGGR